ncbi:RNA degradosome polyphosphate kinase [Laceyella putida]|uniref:Polyphosphate kinase n=1 Tax=Laceyella putida TaxID=110101 RepID=A0ABW2RMH6_9BACL
MRIQTKQFDLNLNNPSYYINREISWLAFNERVLEEAFDEQNPLLERLKFLSIFSSNLDEFFMVRVAGLKDQVHAGFNKPENKAGMTPKQQLAEIARITHRLVNRQYKLLNKTILPLLDQEGICLRCFKELEKEQVAFLENFFDDYIFPVLTPMAIDAYHPFPKLSNKKLNLAVILQQKHAPLDRSKMAIVQVPVGIGRMIEVPSKEKRFFVLSEDVIKYFIHKLFSGYEVKSVSTFRITRNADLSLEEEGARDLLKEIEKELKKRKWGAAVRLEYCLSSMDEEVLEYLMRVLELHKPDIYSIDGPIDLTFLMSFYGKLKDDHEHLAYETFIPQPPQDLIGEADIFEAVRKKDVLLHHPYESFQPVIELISKAADDPDVLAIKMTLYRVSGDSPIVEALARAAENEKQVTVLVELKARFDEENNIQWAKKLERVGVHVIYGLTGLKTHSKITLIVRRTQEGKIVRFVHFGTGNYNDITAKFYTDMSLLTSSEPFAIDATNFFNYLSGYMEQPVWNRISTSPFQLRDHLIRLIDDEIHFHERSGNGRVIAKMNALTDKRLIVKLYEASLRGVQIDLIVRGICCLRPGIPGISENIRVRSIVGRFLEHSRIYYFHHDGEEKMYLSSADWMTRNMEKRVEIAFPIVQRDIKERICAALDLMLKDNRKARVLNEEGTYHYVRPIQGDEGIDSQMELCKWSYRVAEDEE